MCVLEPALPESSPPIDLVAMLQRIEGKLDTLIKALADDGDDGPLATLDGDLQGGDRDQGQSLG